MGKKFGAVALFLGAFLLALAALSKFYMYDRLAVVPQNNVTTSISATADGADAEYLDAAAGLAVVTGPLKSTRVVTGNVELSKEASEELDSDIAVWDTFSCTDKPDFDCGSGDTPLSGTTDRVAFDRTTGESESWDKTSSDSGGIKTRGAFDGLYFKFPFNTQKKEYKFWDGTVKAATTAEYKGEGEVKGLKVYKFEQVIEPTRTKGTAVPGSLLGIDEPTVVADQMYSNVRTFSVEPETGVIIVGGESQDSYLAVDGERKLTTTKATLVYTDENTQNTVDDYKGKATALKAVRTTGPLGGTIIGLLLLALGAFSMLRGKDSGGERRKDTDDADLTK